VKGLYEFPDGSKYEGEWKDQKMHGDGVFTDLNGNKWEGNNKENEVWIIVFQGIFVDGVYQSKIQKQLKYEKQLRILEGQILESAKEFFNKFTKTFSESDKKTFKENLTPFFAVVEDVKTYFKDPFPKYEERVPDKW